MKMLKSLSLFLLVLLFACTPKAVDNTVKTEKEKAEELVGVGMNDAGLVSKTVPVDESVRMGTLPNGMKYYIQQNAKPENRAELRIALNAGAMQEDEDQLGLAHFVEHMCFNGTENFEKSELVDYLESVGTKFGPDLNAYTSFDETVYMLQVRTDDEDIFNTGMAILKDWASAVSFEGEEIDKERGVVQSEWRSGLGADERMRDKWFPVVFKDSRYANRLPIGKPEIIMNASYETVKRFYNDWYRPELMALVVVGDFDDVDAIEAQIKENFASIENPDNPRERKSYDVPNHDETLVSIVTDKEAAFTQVQLMYKHEPLVVNSQKEYRDRMVHSLYNSMLNDRLDELTRSAAPPYIGAYSGYGSFVRGKDMYYASAQVEDGKVLPGLEAVLTENARVLRHGFTKTELERAKEDLINSIERRYKERDKIPSGRLAMRYVSNHLEGTPIPSPKQTLDLYKKFLPTVTVLEVNQLAKNWITDKNRVVVITGPEKEDAPMPTEADVRKTLEKVNSTKIEPYEDNVSDAPIVETNFKGSKVSKVNRIEEVDVTELTLENGVRVILKPTDFQNDQIIFSAYSWGGTSLIKDEDILNAQYATGVIDESGLGEFNATELQKKLAGKTVGVSPYIGSLSEGFSGSAAPKDFETALQLVYAYFAVPRADKNAKDAMMMQMNMMAKNIPNMPEYYFIIENVKNMYDNHPRMIVIPEPEDLDNVTLEKMEAIYKDRFADASDFTFIFVGNFDVAKITPLLEKYLGQLPNIARKESWKDVNMNRNFTAREVNYEKGTAAKSLVSIQYGGEGIDTNDPQNRYDFNSMIEVIKIKLREAMREDEGGVYGVQVRGNLSRMPKQEYSIEIGFNANPEDVEKLLSVCYAELDRIMKEGVEEKDIVKVTETQRQERIKSLKENRFWLNALSTAYQYELDPSNIKLETYEKYIDNLSSDAVTNMMKKCFRQDNRVQFVLNPEAGDESND